MSSDNFSSDERSWWRKLANASGSSMLCILVFAIVAIVFAKAVVPQLTEVKNLVQETQTNQEILRQRLESAETNANATTENIGHVATALAEKDADLAELLTRVEKMQGAFLETAKDIEQIKWQAKDVEAAKARSLAGAKRIQARAEPVERNLKRLDQLLVDWTQHVTPLYQNEAGRRIVASPEHFQRFRIVPKVPPISKTQIAAWKTSLKELMTPVETALSEDQGAFRTVEAHLKELEILAAEIDQANKTISQDLRETERLIEETQHIPLSRQTLAEALAEVQEKQEQANREAMLAARKAAHAQALEESKRRVAEESKRAVEAEQEVQLLKLEKETLKKQAEAAQIRRNNQDLDRALARTKLLDEFEAELPQIRSLLRAFITPGLMKIGEQRFVRSGDPIPMSLGRIRGFGALEKSDEGLERLHYLGGSPDNWRSNRGAFPAYAKRLVQRDRSVRKQVENAQELLTKYGEILVEKGYLGD